MPPEITALIGGQQPERVLDSFVDETLRESQTDFNLRVPLQGEDLLIYLLLEHKAKPDELTRLQLLRYLERALTQWHEDNKRLPLPLIVPVVVYNGDREWNISTEIAKLFEGAGNVVRSGGRRTRFQVCL